MTTLREFTINYNAKEIYFCGKPAWKYEIRDAEMNEVVEETTDCRMIFMRGVDGYDATIGLNSHPQIILAMILDFLQEGKSRIIRDDIEYWKQYRKMHEWNMRVVGHMAEIRKKLLGYESAAMEPDMNVLAQFRQEIIGIMDELETEYERMRNENG